MRVSQVVKDIPATIRELVNALSNRLHAEDNFAPDGEAGQVLTSNGPDIPPSWKGVGSLPLVPGEPTTVGGGGGGGGGGGVTLPAGAVERFMWHDGTSWTAKRIVTGAGDVVVAAGEVVVSP